MTQRVTIRPGGDSLKARASWARELMPAGEQVIPPAGARSAARDDLVADAVQRLRPRPATPERPVVA